MNPSSSVLAVANDGMMNWSSLALAVADEVDNEFIITCAGCDDVMIIMLSMVLGGPGNRLFTISTGCG